MAIVKNNKLFNDLNKELKKIESLENITKQNLENLLIEESKILYELGNIKTELENNRLKIEEPIVSIEEQQKVSTFFEVLADCVKSKINDKVITQEVIILEPDEDDQEAILSHVDKNPIKVKGKPGRKPKNSK